MKVINNNMVMALKSSYLIKYMTGREDKSPLGRYSHRWVDNIKIYLKEITWSWGAGLTWYNPASGGAL